MSDIPNEAVEAIWAAVEADSVLAANLIPYLDDEDLEAILTAAAPLIRADERRRIAEKEREMSERKYTIPMQAQEIQALQEEIARLIIDRDQARAEYADLQGALADSMDLEKPIRPRSDNAFNTYQEKTAQTAIYPGDQALEYLIPGLAAEAGEVAGKWAKIIRDQGGAYDQADEDEIIKEVGDVLWMVARIAAELGVSLDVVAERNLQKLADRKKRGVLGGSGDHR